MRFSKSLLPILFGHLVAFSSLVTIAQDAKINDSKILPILALADKGQIRERVKYLADDQLRGRLPGTPGYQMAVDFVTKELQAMNIKPMGTNGYVQEVILRKSVVDTTQSNFKLNGKALRYGKDYVYAPDLNKLSGNAAAEVVYAGYGIVAPQLNHNDYQNIEVKGKIVVLRGGTPENFPASERAHFNLGATKSETASRMGAVGVVLLVSGNEPVQMAAQSRASLDGVNAYVNKDGSTFTTRANPIGSVQFFASVRSSLFGDLLKETTPRKLDLKIEAKSTSRYSDMKTENLIGVIPGNDPKLKNEYVIHTAHLDHVGVGTPIKGDSIYNGAHDNASGVACLLEIAKLYKASSVKRSVLIVFVTSEEKGLLGSGFFASNPVVPKEKIVANVNTDMPTIIAPLLSIAPLGAAHSSLINQVNAAANYLNLEVAEDHIPEQVRFVRSDQYSFIRQGIPALHVKYGLKTNDPTIDLRKKIEEWTEAHYHKPSDEFSDAAFDFDAGVTYVKLNFLIGWQVANEKQRPTWNKGDFFGEMFGRK